MGQKAKVIKEDGSEGIVDVGDGVTKADVDKALSVMGPILREYGTSVGESIRDGMESGLEKLAKALEEERAINEEAVLERASRKYVKNGVIGDDIMTDAERKGMLKDYMFAVTKAGRNMQRGDAERIATEMGSEFAAKALSASDYGSAGILIPDEIWNGLKEIKDDAVVIRRVAGRNLVLKHGATSLPKELVSASAFYADESDDLTLTTFKRGEDRIEPKKLTVLIAVTNELMRDGANVGQIIIDQMRRAYALKENATLIRGTGTAKQPMGLRYQVDASHINARSQAGSSSTVQEIRNDLIDAMVNPMIANLDGAGAWMFPAAVFGGLSKRLANDSSMAPFAAELNAGRLFGQPTFITNAIPDNLGAGDEAEVYFVLRNELMIVDSQDLTLDTSRDASYKDSDGTLVSCFSRDEQVTRLIGRSDIHLMYPKAASVITTVDWNTNA
jgi:HK97 family phage major capsid protein